MPKQKGTAVKRKPKHGKGMLQIGNPGNKGGPGRRPDAFKAKMRTLVSTDSKLKHLEKILNNPNHPQYVAAYKMAVEIGYGKAVQPLEIGGTGGGPLEVIVRHEIVDPSAS